jgi:hypothetical protein
MKVSEWRVKISRGTDFIDEDSIGFELELFTDLESLESENADLRANLETEKENSESNRLAWQAWMGRFKEVSEQLATAYAQLESSNGMLKVESNGTRALVKELERRTMERDAARLDAERLRGALDRLNQSARAIIPQADNQAQNSEQVDKVMALSDASHAADDILSFPPSEFAREVREALKILAHLSKQRLDTEISTEDQVDSDYQGAYNIIITEVRNIYKILSSLEVTP